jgi:hypothetical protein
MDRQLRNFLLALVYGALAAAVFDSATVGLFAFLLIGIWFSLMDAVDLLAKLERR